MKISYTKYGDYYFPDLTVSNKDYNIGCNINQIAYIANAERHIPDEQLNRAVKLMNDVWRCVRSYR